jgi:response regulator RpfG family c-di-GMP phosphodiesterase
MNDSVKLVFVDDEPNILKALQRVFFDDDYDITTFTTGQEALEHISNNEIVLIISDQRMPGMTGTQLFTEVVKVKPETKRIILTGFADMGAAVDAINTGSIYHFVFKPWNDEELRSTVRRAIHHYKLEQQNEELLEKLAISNDQLAEANDELSMRVKERTAIIAKKNLELGKLNSELEKSLVSTVRFTINLMELSRPSLCRENRILAQLAMNIARRLNWPEAKMRKLEIAALMLNVGKIGIPDPILNRQSQYLSEDERRLMRHHPIMAQTMLGTIPAFEDAAIIVRHQDEWYDGTGFPDGLKAKDIPEESRLLAACSTYFRLKNREDGNSRPFILKYFRNNSKTQFDPQFIDIMFDIIFTDEDSVDIPKRQLEVFFHELKPGMMLADDLKTGKGIFLLPSTQVLTESNISSIQDIQKVDPISGRIKVLVPEKHENAKSTL